MEEKQKIFPQSPPAQKRAPGDLVVLDRSLFRTAFISAAVFLVILTGGTLWTLYSLGNRQTEVLREEFVRLATELRQPIAGRSWPVDDEPYDQLTDDDEDQVADADEDQLTNANEDQVANADAEDPLTEIEKLIEDPSLADSAFSQVADKPTLGTLSVSAESTASAPVTSTSTSADYALPEDAALAASRELNTSPVLTPSAPTNTTSFATSRTSDLTPRAEQGTSIRIASLSTNPPTQSTTPTVPDLPIRKFKVKAKIKTGPQPNSNSGGLFLASPDDRNREELQQEPNNYLRKTNNLPLGLPVQGTIGSRFGSRSDPFNRRRAFHSGIDFPGKPGTPVRSTADGMVVYSGFTKDYGHHIIISHGRDFETLYAHLSKRLVEKDRLIKKGQKIGLIGSTGRSTGPHLHYEVRQHGKPINPMQYIAGGKVIPADTKPSKRTVAKKFSSKQTKQKKQSVATQAKMKKMNKSTQIKRFQ